MASTDEEPSLLDKLDSMAPAPLKSFDAFPKLPSTYKSRSESRGFLTVLIGLVAFLLVLNDIAEFVWGWPDYEFSVDRDPSSYMDINVDMMVNMPCRYLSVDLRDAVGDRLYLSKGFRRDGTLFDIGQATSLKEHAEALSARQAVAQSRATRGFFSFLRGSGDKYKKTFNHQPDGSACRVYGSLSVKKVTANLHITTLGHGYTSRVHVPHNLMNLSHVFNEFSFGPHFPEIVQPLDNSLELTNDPFVAYQYFLRVVPTTFVAPRSSPLQTNQYSVTHYTRVMEHNSGTPGIFLKFDIEPVRLTIIQRTTTIIQFLIRWFGVVGGVFVCASWALRITHHAVTYVAGPSDEDSIAPAPSARSSSLRTKWAGGSLRARPANHLSRLSGSWTAEGSAPNSPYSPSMHSPYPVSPYPGTLPFSPSAQSPVAPPPMSSRLPSAQGLGLGPSSPAFGPRSPYSPAAPSPMGPGVGYGVFPPTPAPGTTGFPLPRMPSGGSAKKEE